MSDFHHKPGSGSLFKNDRMDKETSPQYTGSLVTPDGAEYWINAWVNDGTKGKYFGLSVKLKEPRAPQQPAAPQAPSRPAGHDDFEDSDLPF